MTVKSKRLAQLTLQLMCAASFAGFAHAEDFNIPRGDLKAALDTYATQTGTQFIYESAALKGIQTQGVHGNLPADAALSRILTGTGFTMRKDATGAIGITRTMQSMADTSIVLAQANPSARAAVETVTVTSSKLGGADVQSIPIAITALSQEQLTATQTAGGPDLVKQVPNLTFTKTNFSGYSIQIRGIGTQAISVTTDPAVAVAMNDTPFIRNHFFEQEFYDVSQVEVLRGPQGTLYGRNATAGVVNMISAKPTDQFEAMASAEFGNYGDKRFEGMVNIPILDDRVDLRIAGEWTKRSGYSFNALTNNDIDGRDLWSGRLTLGWHPLENLHAYFVWEHFSENDDRLRSSKQLCKNTPLPSSVNGVSTGFDPNAPGGGIVAQNYAIFLAQGCAPVSLYSPEAFQVPNGYTLPYYAGLSFQGTVTSVNPYRNSTQSTDLRVIESQINPSYKAKNDVVQLNADYDLSPALTFTSQTAFNHDFLWSTEDYNRFEASPGLFTPNLGGSLTSSVFNSDHTLTPDGIFCDPQLGCSDKLLAEDLSQEHSWQFNQEFRLASHLSGPFNFSVGGNYQHYETLEDYYVFINSLTVFTYWQAIGVPGVSYGLARPPWVPGVSDNSQCMYQEGGFKQQDPSQGGGGASGGICAYIDPNPIGSLNGNGHNYFRSVNPYTLNSYASFGEAYVDIFKDLKFTGGLRWTEDQKHFTDIPSELLAGGWGYPSTGVVDQQWDAITGRTALNWTPKLDFTDQTLLYGSYAHGYKAGGANPPGAVLLTLGQATIGLPIHPLTFKPEYVDAFELGTKNTLLDGSLTLNGNVFYYNYQHYQISELVDRTAINLNFDAHVKGAEVEATWEPIPGLRFNASGGYEDARAANGEKAIDLMDRTDSANHPDWMVVKPFLTGTSNCVFPVSEVGWLIKYSQANPGTEPNPATQACGYAYTVGYDPVTRLPYTANPPQQTALGNKTPAGYPGFNPASAPNNGEGFDKDLSHHTLPNAPPFTFSAGAQYSMPLSTDWAGTLRADFYWQDDSWARIFNDNPYDRLHGYTNLNLTLILTNQDGWQAMGFIKNVMNTTAITGSFLNTDDSGLTTNVFLTDPRLIGVRVTKNW
jgi:outer membrane receptor protein involved in Fe transport